MRQSLGNISPWSRTCVRSWNREFADDEMFMQHAADVSQLPGVDTWLQGRLKNKGLTLDYIPLGVFSFLFI